MQNQNVQYEFHDESNYGSGKKKGGIVWIVIASLALISACLVGLYFYMDSTQYKGEVGELGQLDGKTAEEIQEALNKYVEDGTLDISIAAVARFPDGKSKGELRIQNSPNNKYLMQVDISRNDNGEIIYSSAPIEPNHHIQNDVLKVALPAGSYPCTATFYAVNPENNEVVGQAGADVLILVEN